MGFVYLLVDQSKDNTYKIGVTRTTIEKRIKQLQTGSSGEITMSMYYETSHPYFIEKQLHSKFKKYRLEGEWFELPPKIALNFEEECKFAENMINILKDNPFMSKNIK